MFYHKLHFCGPTETVCEYEVQFHQRLEQERAQWNQYREAMEREVGDLRRRLTEGQEEENLEDEMKKVGLFFFLIFKIFLGESTCIFSALTYTPALHSGKFIFYGLVQLFAVKPKS